MTVLASILYFGSWFVYREKEYGSPGNDRDPTQAKDSGLLPVKKETKEEKERKKEEKRKIQKLQRKQSTKWRNNSESRI
ncbi:MAG: hypothetical protein ACLUP5_02840 [Streptococcus sp.]